MAGITLAQAEAKLADVQTAIEAVLERGQSYTIGNRTFTRASLKDLQDLEKYYDGLVKRLSAGGIRTTLSTPA